MANVSVYNIEGKEVGTIDLNDAVFGVEVNEHLVHMAVVSQLANKRQGTQKAKTREVRRENMGNMISVHREECNYEGTEAELMGCQKPLRFCLSYFCISGKRIHCLVLAVERFCICCWCRGCFRPYLKKYSRKL